MKNHEHDAPKPCATCGTCPTCGRRPQGSVYPYPYYPWTQPYVAPYITWGTTTSPNTSGFVQTNSTAIDPTQYTFTAAN